MNDVTPADPALSPARVALREPLGERTLAAPLRIGAAGSAVVVPAASPDEAIEITFDGDHWVARQDRTRRELRAGDVLALGAARIVVTAVPAAGSGAPLALEVRHLAGNDTIAPLAVARDVEGGEAAADEDIIAAALEAAERAPTSGTRAAAAPPPRRRRTWLAAAALAVLSAGVVTLLASVERVPVSVEPGDADVAVDGLLAWASGGALFALPGPQVVRATRDGYAPLERSITVTRPAAGGSTASPPRVVLQLTKLPGVLALDTGGVPVTVTVDGAPAGRGPGDIEVPAGRRTLTLRSPRHLDLVQVVDVEGGGVRQPLKLALQSAWGQLSVSARQPGARVSVDGGAPVALPAQLDLPGGVHRLRITADGARDWESSVLVRAGQAVAVGPVELGAPDARLAVRSAPSGAEVTVAGEFRGRTPVSVLLPAGARYDVLVTRPGYRTWQRSVTAEAGASVALDARLDAVTVALTVRGEPADAELFLDGVSRGRTPAKVDALAMRQRLEVRRAGMQTFVQDLDLSSGLARTIDYRLLPEGKPADWRPPSSTAASKAGIALRLVQGGTFSMGSERREAGRRPNEVLRRVTLARPFYMGQREVTNAEFRRFRGDHASGALFSKSVDLDAQPVSNVSWDDAVAFCNWLSEQDGLPPAYERRDNRWVLRQPVGTGYRLPSEAEWEFVARGASATPRRYGWGDALPVPAGYANLAGAEAVASLPAVLDGYADEHLVVAPVGKYAATGGYFDFTGNLSEWVHDAYSSAPSPAPATDPFGPDIAGNRHVIKGSNWRTASFTELRLAWREVAESASDSIGFRVARYAE